MARHSSDNAKWPSARGNAVDRGNWARENDGAEAVALYLADMSGQLESMARAAHLDLLAYLLAMARAEAESFARSPSDEADDHDP